VDCPFPKLDVAGSNPVARSRRKHFAERRLSVPIRGEWCGAELLGMQNRSAFPFAWELQMARTKRGTPPSYRRHSSGQACVTVRASDGRRREILLGPWESPESKAEYARVLAELAANQGRMRP
jgi:hypothetical protein